MKMKLLTIAIPTKGTRKSILPLVERTLDQIYNDNEIELLISFNNKTEIHDELNSIICKKYSNIADRVKIISNIIDMNGDANILNSIANVNSKFAWLVGDDDLIKPNVISEVKNIICKNLDAEIINLDNKFLIRNKVFGEQDGYGAIEYLKRFDKISDALFISNKIISINNIKNYFPEVYRMQMTCAAHLILEILKLGESNKFIISDLDPFELKGVERKNESFDECQHIIYGHCLIKLFPFNLRIEQQLKKLINFKVIVYLSLKSIYIRMLKNINKKEIYNEAIKISSVIIITGKFSLIMFAFLYIIIALCPSKLYIYLYEKFIIK